MVSCPGCLCASSWMPSPPRVSFLGCLSELGLCSCPRWARASSYHGGFPYVFRTDVCDAMACYVSLCAWPGWPLVHGPMA
ncbi:hypothetical protein V6N12_005824 [Hibiscus sabdariffa]|uniref:Secreted protein n=1 Tax=Hibiscus sabdariffa TaxID=183260 RepID=A0ABR1ZL57_9ROSI